MDNLGKKTGKFIACAMIGVLLVGVVSYITMYLWNWLVPDLFNGPVITFWQALGLLLLSKLLFWGFGGKRHAASCGDSSAGHKLDFSQKFSSMSPEDREAFKQKMRDKWCRWEEKKHSNPPDSTNV